MKQIKTFVLAIACVHVFTGAIAYAVVNCNGTIDLNSTQTLTEDYAQTIQTVNPCIRMTGGTSQTVNLGGHTITCNSNTGICGRAIQDDGGGTVKNGNVVAGSGDWQGGVSCYSDGPGVYNDCQVSNMYIEATGAGIQGGKNIDTSVILGPDRCIDSIKTLTSGGFYRQNYCSAGLEGFRFYGPASGTFTVERNFIRAASTGTGIEVQSGNGTIQHNIIDASTPINDTNGGSVSLSENICSNATDCPDPTVRGFSLTLDFN